MNWTPAATLPEPGRKVLAHYRNASGKSRIVIARRIPAEYEEADCDWCEIGVYSEAKDAYFWPAGWYEQIENWDDYSGILMHQQVTHWMPLPTVPEEYREPNYQLPQGHEI